MAIKIATRSAHFRIEGEDANKELTQKLLVRHDFPLITDWKPKGTVEPFINDGRWIAFCPLNCGGAEIVDPDWPLLVCSSGCGAGPYSVKFPAKRQQVEAKYIKDYWKGPKK